MRECSERHEKRNVNRETQDEKALTDKKKKQDQE